MSTINKPPVDPLTGRPILAPEQALNEVPQPQVDVYGTMRQASEQALDPTASTFNPYAAQETLDVLGEQMGKSSEAADRKLRESQGIYEPLPEDEGYKPGGTARGIDVSAWVDSQKAVKRNDAYQRNRNIDDFITQYTPTGDLFITPDMVERQIEERNQMRRVQTSADAWERIYKDPRTGADLGPEGMLVRSRESLTPEQQQVTDFLDLKDAVRKRVEQEDAIKRGEWGAWIQRSIEEKTLEIQRTGGAGKVRGVALSIPSGVLSGLQSISGFASLLGSGLEAWSEDIFGFQQGTTGEATATFFNNISGILELGKQNMTGSSDQTVQVLNAMGDGVGQLGVALGLALLTGGSGAIPMFVGSAGVQAAGGAYNQSYLKALQSGYDQEGARAIASVDAALYGISSTILQAIPAGAIFGRQQQAAAQILSKAAVADTVKRFSSNPYIIRKVAAGAAAEGFQEVAEDALGTMVQIATWGASGGDPLRRAELYRNLTSDDPKIKEQAWSEVLTQFAGNVLGGAGGGAVAGKIVQATDLSRWRQNLDERQRAWNAFERGVSENPDIVKERQYLGSAGNAADLSQEQLEAAARGKKVLDETDETRAGVAPGRKDQRLIVNPLDAVKELQRRGLPVPADAVKPVEEPKKAAEATKPSADGKRSIFDGLDLVDRKTKKPIAVDNSGIDAAKLSALDEAEVEKLVTINPDAVQIILGTPGVAASAKNIARLFTDPALAKAMESVLSDPKKRAELLEKMMRASAKGGKFAAPKTAPAALSPAEQARLDEIDAALEDETKRPKGADLLKMLRERQELVVRKVFGTKDEDLEPLSPYEKEQLGIKKAAVADPRTDAKDKARLTAEVDLLERRSRSAKTWAAPALPTVTPDPAGKPLSTGETNRLKQIVAALTDGRPLKSEKRLAWEEEYKKLKAREGIVKPAPAPAPAPAPKPAPTPPPAPPKPEDLGPLSPYEKEQLNIKRKAFFSPTTTEDQKKRLKDEIDLLEARDRLPGTFKAPALPAFTPATSGKPLTAGEKDTLARIETSLTDGRPLTPETRAKQEAKWIELKSRENLVATPKPAPAPKAPKGTATPAPAPAPAPEPTPATPPVEAAPTEAPAAPAPEPTPETPTEITPAVEALSAEDQATMSDISVAIGGLDDAFNPYTEANRSLLAKIRNGDSFTQDEWNAAGYPEFGTSILVGIGYLTANADGTFSKSAGGDSAVEAGAPTPPDGGDLSPAAPVAPSAPITPVPAKPKGTRAVPASRLDQATRRRNRIRTIARVMYNMVGNRPTNTPSPAFSINKITNGARTGLIAQVWEASYDKELALDNAASNAALIIAAMPSKGGMRAVATPAWLVNSFQSSRSNRIEIGKELYAKLDKADRDALVNSGFFDIYEDSDGSMRLGIAQISATDVLQAQAYGADLAAEGATLESADQPLAAYAGERMPPTEPDKMPGTLWKKRSATKRSLIPKPMEPLFTILRHSVSNFLSPAGIYEAMGASSSAQPGDLDYIDQSAQPRLTRSQIAEATKAAQDALGSMKASGFKSPSHHLVASGSMGAEFAHDGQANISRLASLGGNQHRFANSSELGKRLGYQPESNPINIANSNGILVVETTAHKGGRTHGLFDPYMSMNVRMTSRRAADGTVSYSLSSAAPDVPLQDDEFMLSMPVIMYTQNMIKETGAGSDQQSRQRAGLFDTLMHEMWHALLIGKEFDFGASAALRTTADHEKILERIEKQSPELYDLIMAALKLHGYSRGQMNEERAVRIAAKMSALILSDPAELHVVLGTIVAEAKARKKAPLAFSWIVASVNHATDLMISVAKKFGKKGWAESAAQTAKDALDSAGFGPIAEPSSDFKTLALASLVATPETAEEVGNRMALMASELRILMGTAEDAYQGTVGKGKQPSGEGTLEYDIEVGRQVRVLADKRGSEEALDALVDLILAANEAMRPFAIASTMRAGLQTIEPTAAAVLPGVPATRPVQSSAYYQLSIENIVDDPSNDSDPDEDTVIAEQDARDVSAKSFGGKTLKLIGIKLANAWVVSKRVVESAMLRDKSVNPQRTSAKNYYKENIERFAAIDDRAHRLSINETAITADPSYASMTATGKKFMDAAIYSAQRIVGEDLDDALKFSRPLEKDQEEAIESVLSSSKATGASRSTLEFLLRVIANDLFGPQIIDNANRKAGDPGWIVPPVRSIRIVDGGIDFDTGTIGWGLFGEQESLTGLRDEKRTKAEARNERRREQTRKNAAKRLVDRVNDLNARAAAGDESAQRIIRENRWYNEIFDRLRTAFGNHQIMFSELLAALSPQTPADTNYKYAVEAMRNFTEGKYDALIARYVDWVTDSDRIAALNEVNAQIDLRDKELAKLRRQTGRKYPAKKDKIRKVLAKRRADLGVYTGPTPFRDILVTQGKPFPSDPYEDKEGKLIYPKPKLFMTMTHLVKAYGPSKEDFKGNSRGYAKARKEWTEAVRANNPMAFDRRGRLVEGATISVTRKFGINSKPALNVMAGIWATNISSPKVHTFFSNLSGLGTNATIDLWAARALRSALGLPRIPAYAETSVKGEVQGGNIDTISGEYAFAQSIMHDAARELGMDPMNLQALLWFAEKDLWNTNGWTSSAGQAGSFERSHDRDPLTLIETSIDTTDIEPDSSVLGKLISQLKNDKSVISIQYNGDQRSTAGRRIGLGMTVRYKQFDTNDFAEKIAGAIREAGSTSRVTVTQTIPFGIEKTPNSRPAFTVNFTSPRSIEEATGLAVQIEGENPGWHIEILTDPRVDRNGVKVAKPGIGLRIHYAAETDPAIRANAMRSSDATTASQDEIMRLRTDKLTSHLSDLHKRKIINDAAKAMAVESITYGLEGVPDDKQGVAAFSDFRSGQPVESRSVQAVAAEAVGIESGFGGSERVGDEPADGYPEGTDAIAERVVPEEVLRQHRRAVENIFPNDGPEPIRVREPSQELAGETNEERERAYGTGDGAGRASVRSLAPLEGAPSIKGASGPDPNLIAVAESYARDRGIDLKRQAYYASVDEDRARRIAAAYEAMPHAPNDPVVKEAYENLISQLRDQYDALVQAGYKFWFFDENTDPYAGNPWNAMRDLRATKSMGVFATEAGFGTSDFNASGNPLLVETGLMWPYGSPDGEMKRVFANDLFRAVHDALGHGIEGSGFRAAGEENAWQAHVRLFTGSAIAALTSETRGQNSWLNYGPYGEKNQTAPVAETVFADQKTGLMPSWTWEEGRVPSETSEVRRVREPSREMISSSDDTDVALPPELETPEPRGGAMSAVKRFFGRTDEVAVVSRKKEGDLGVIRRWLLPLITSAWSSANRQVRFVAEEMVSSDLERMRVTNGIIEQGKDLFSKLPREYRSDNGKKFYKLMDRFYDPTKPNSDSQWVDESGNRLADDVIDILREFKRIDEDQRLGIINAKRDSAKEIVRYMGTQRLLRVAAENGANWAIERVRYGPGRREYQTFVMDTDTGDMMTIDEAREAIVKVMVPDDWGRQFSHIFHGFFGSYEGFWYSKSAYRDAKARGESDEQALRSARRSIAMDGGTATANTEGEMTRRLLAFRKNPPPGIAKDDIGRIEINIQTYVPPDVVRVSGRQYDALRKHIQDAAGVESAAVNEMLRGRIGRTEGKQRFYAPLLERKGKEGFDMDFMRAWEAQTAGYYKWLYYNRMRRNVTATIEDLRRQGYVGWAAHFQDTLDYTTTFKQSQFEQAIDGLIASIPGLRTMVGPLPTRRWLQMVRSVNVARQLWTVRQQVVNSMQPLQTVFPIIGGKRFVSYMARYNGREGKEMLSKYGYLRPNGEWFEGKEFRMTSGTGWLTRVYEPIKKIMQKSPIAGSESRNQNFTFFAFYTYAKEELGMEDNEAARHALLRVAQTQFSFTKANNPVIFRGPTRATLLQYKRFMLSSIGLAQNIIHARHPVTGELLPRRTRGAMFARWMSTFLVAGGLKGLPVYFLLDAIAWALEWPLDEKKRATGYDIYAELREQLGDNWANMLVMGLPSAAGVDISGSIVLFPKPYGRTTYEQLGAFIAGPTLSAVGDVYTSLANKDAVYQSGFREVGNAVLASSPAFQQILNFTDAVSGASEQYDVQGRLKFRKTLGEQVRGVMGFRTTRESLESLEYNKIVVMQEAIDAYKDEIATLAASGKIVEMQQKIRAWNAMFPEMPLPFNMKALMKDPSIGRRIKRKIDDRTLDTRQRRLKSVNDDLARVLVDRYGVNVEEEP